MDLVLTVVETAVYGEGLKQALCIFMVTGFALAISMPFVFLGLEIRNASVSR